MVVGDAPYAADYIRGLRATTDPRVVFTGYVFGEGYRELLSNAYCFALTSEVGGTHPALLEAMAAGRAVVVNDTPENLETLGEAGLSYDGAVGAASLRAALERLLKDPDLVVDARAAGPRARPRALLLGRRHRRVRGAVPRDGGRSALMLGKRRAEWVLRLLAVDVVVLLTAFLAAYGLRVALDEPIGRAAAPLHVYLWLLGLIVPLWLALLAGVRGVRRALDGTVAPLAGAARQRRRSDRADRVAVPGEGRRGQPQLAPPVRRHDRRRALGRARARARVPSPPRRGGALVPRRHRRRDRRPRARPRRRPGALSGGGLARPRRARARPGRSDGRGGGGSRHRHPDRSSRAAPGRYGRGRGVLRGAAGAPRGHHRDAGDVREPGRRRARAGRPVPARPRPSVRRGAVRAAVLRLLADADPTRHAGGEARGRSPGALALLAVLLPVLSGSPS